MKKNLLLAIMIAAVLCLMPLATSAATDGAGAAAGSNDEWMIPAVDDLNKVLPRYIEAYGSGTARLAEGNWNVSKTVDIPDGVTLDLNGQTVNSSAIYAFDLSGSNASIENGTINNGGIRVSGDDSAGHITNVAVKKAPANGILVNSRSAIGLIKGNTISDSSAMGIKLFSKAKSGNIENNTITGAGDHAIQVSGNSTASSSDGSSAGDIANNTIRNCRAHGISIYHGSHVGKITGNTLDTIGGKNDNGGGDYAITINSGTGYETYAEEITNNTVINARYASIVVYSVKKNSGNASARYKAYITGDIANNTVTGSGTIKSGVNWLKKSSLECQGAIYVASYADVRGDIHDNVITSSHDDGINIRDGARVNNIYNNSISSAANYGIAVKDAGSVNGAVYGNTIEKAGVNGLMVNSKSVIRGAVRNNTIAAAGQNGIFVTNKSKAGKISNNNVKNAKLYGVIAGNGGKISSLESNSISVSNAKAGIAVICNTGSLIAKINKNKISGKYACGIRVKSPTAKVQVIGNDLKAGNPSSKRATGISVEGCKKKTISILSNKIKGNNRGAGIALRTSAAKIKKNKISRCKPKKSISKGSYKVIQ